MTKVSGAGSEADVREIVDMLWLRDSTACARAEWSAVQDDFDADAFVGYLGGPGAAHWRIGYPDLASYRDAWVEGGRSLAEGYDAATLAQELLRASDIAEIEVNGRWALVRKDFAGEVGADRAPMRGRTYYFCRRDADRWRIVGFVAGLPADSASPTVGPPVGATKTVPNPDGLLPRGPYSNTVVVPAGDLVVISGQGPLDQDGKVAGDTIEEQAVLTLEHCRRKLEAGGAGLDDVFKVSVYLADLDMWDRFNNVYRDVMPQPFPARTAVGTGLLLGMLVEVDMWARRPDRGLA